MLRKISCADLRIRRHEFQATDFKLQTSTAVYHHLNGLLRLDATGPMVFCDSKGFLATIVPEQASLNPVGVVLMRVVRGAMNIDKHPQHFWLNFTTFRRFSPFHLFHCSSTINRAAGRRGYGHVSAPKGQATSFYRQHFSKSNDQTQMIPNLIVEIVEQKMLVIKNCIDLDGLHSIHLHLSHLSPLSW